MNMTPLIFRPIAIFALAMLPAVEACAEGAWETVVRDRNRQVQIDRNSIIRSDAGTKVAWGRIVLAPIEAAKQSFATVQALNRYDCANRSFYTVKRRYLDARNVVIHEEDIIAPQPVPVAGNTVDERLWREVCRPPALTDLTSLASEAERAAALLAGRPYGQGMGGGDAGPGATRARAEPPLPAVAAAAAADAPPERTPERTPAASAGAAAWSYSGETGPEHWGRLRPDWALCADGTRQSPTDLRNGIAVDLDPILFDYRSTRFRITDTSRMLQVHVGAGMGVEIRGQRYELEHFQLHWPSKERIDGRAYDMVVHFHHRDAAGRMAIVAVQLEAGARPHALVQTLWGSLPLERGGDYMPLVPIDLATLLPASPAHFLYMGSLTTPPCTEGVLWAVMKEPVPVGDEQVEVFARLYPRNSRPIQPAYDRRILQSR